MPISKVKFAPGIVKEITEYSAEGRWSDGNLVRFRDGFPEKVKGWLTKDLSLAGTCRDVLPFQEIDQTRNIAFATHNSLEILQDGALTDITPVRKTSNTITVATTNTDATVSVGADSSHGAAVGDRVFLGTFSGDGVIGGITMPSVVTVATVVDADNWTFEASSAATSTDSETATLTYVLATGTEFPTLSLEYGAGVYGDADGNYGQTRSSGGITIEARQWSLDQQGEDLLACVRNGEIYKWDASSGPGTRAASLGGSSPSQSRLILTTPDRYLLSLGAHDGSSQDPLLIRWSDQEDFTTFTPSSTNTAGDFRLSQGSKIVSATRSRRESIIFTDTAAYSMTSVGLPFVFGFNLIGEACGSIGQHAAIDINGITYWMGDCDFYFYDGRVNVLNCDVRSFVYDNLNVELSDMVYAGRNKAETEVMWFYATDTNNDRVVSYNYEDGTWWIGELDRVVWADRDIFDLPVAVDTSKEIFDHDTGNSANNSAMACHIESADVDITDGDRIMFMRKFLPDMEINSGSVDIYIKARNYPGESKTAKGPFTIISSTSKVNMRARGRQLSLRMESNGTNDDWRGGDFRFEVNTDGRR